MNPHADPPDRDHSEPRLAQIAQTTVRNATFLVLWLWSTLRYRSEADRWHVLVACQSSLTDAASPRVAAHMNVLLRFRDDTGGQVTPARRSYNAWRDQQHDRDALPSATALANTFRGWPKAAEAVGMNITPDVLARRITQHGRRLTNEETLDALRAWHKTNPSKLIYSAYRKWAEEANQDPDRGLPWVPLNRGGFIERFGSWSHALHAAGLVDESWLVDPKTERGRYGTRRIPAEVLLDALRSASKEHDCDAITMSAYRDLYARQKDSGQTPLPSFMTIVNRFGTWAEALFAAGLIDRVRADAKLRKGGRRIPDEQLLDALRAAMAVYGEAITVAQYRLWRLEQVEADANTTPPGAACIISRYEKRWSSAVEQALSAHRRQED